MSDIHWLTSDEVVQLNAWVVEQTGEPHIVRSLDLVESALGRLINHHAYERVDDVLWLAVILLFGISRNHAFVQGNKRTGFHAARLFLRRNGYDWVSDDAVLGDMIILVIENRMTERQFYEEIVNNVLDQQTIELRERFSDMKVKLDNRIESIASFILADSQQESIKRYIDKGRIFQNETDDYIDQMFIDEMKAWASSPPPWKTHERLEDIECEISLRGRELPSNDEVAGYLQIIASFVRKSMESDEFEMRRDDIQRDIDKFHEQKRGGH